MSVQRGEIYFVDLNPVHGREQVRRSFEIEYRPIFMTSTTGRSADPIPFLYTSYDLDRLRIAGRRVMEVCAARHDFRLLNMFPYAPHLAFWFTHYASTEFGVFNLGTGGGKLMGTEGNLRLIRPLAYVTEDLSTEYARVQGFLPISCVCGEKESVRREIREFLDAMKSRHLGISESITASLGNVNPYTLFATPDLVGVGTEDEMEF